MPLLDTYLTYKEHVNDVPMYRAAMHEKENAEKAAFADKKLTPEELSLAAKRGELVKRIIDYTDEYAQTTTGDVETVTQTVLGESISLLTAAGVGIGKLYQATDSGKKLTEKIAIKLGKFKSAAPKVIPGASGLLFAIISSIPMLFSLTTIEIQTPRMARFEVLKSKLSNPNDYAVFTDSQIAEAKKNAEKINIEPKPTDKSIISSLNIFSLLKSYTDIVAKRVIYKKEKHDFDQNQALKMSAVKNESFDGKETEKAKETAEIMQRLVGKIDLDAQDYIERVFKILDVISLCLFGFGVVGFWALDKAMSLLKIKDGAFKKYFSVLASVAGVILLNSKIAEYRNNAIRISRHKQLKELLKDPKNFLKAPENKKSAGMQAERQERKGLFAFMKEFAQDLREYEEYATKQIPEDKKFILSARNIKLSEEQKKDAVYTKSGIFKMINIVDDKKKKYEEKIDILTTLMTTPMGLCAATLGNAAGWLLHKAKNAPKSHMPFYSIIGTAIGLVPAIAIEVYTTIMVRDAARVSYMEAHKELSNNNIFLEPHEELSGPSKFFNMSFKNSDFMMKNFK